MLIWNDQSPHEDSRLVTPVKCTKSAHCGTATNYHSCRFDFGRFRAQPTDLRKVSTSVWYICISQCPQQLVPYATRSPQVKSEYSSGRGFDSNCIKIEGGCKESTNLADSSDWNWNSCHTWTFLVTKFWQAWAEGSQEPPYMPLSMIFLKSPNFNAFLILLRGDFRNNTLLVELRALVARWLN